MLHLGRTRSPKSVVVAKFFKSKKNYSTEGKKGGTFARKYQFLQNSKLPTLYFQKSLPRLPIPELDKTCQRYLAAVEPIVTPDAFSKTKSIVSKFASTGQQLQNLLKLQDASNKHTSYISQPWFDMYLSDRAPLPINYNPLLVMKPDTRSEYNRQLIRAANLVISSLRFWRALLTNRLEPEIYHMNPSKSDNDWFRTVCSLAPGFCATYVAYAFKAFPLDMSQYNRLFGVTRIPKAGKDVLHQAAASSSRHILVIRGGKYFAVNVLNPDGSIVPANQIYGRLKAIMEGNPSGEVREPQPLGLMTTADRDVWAKTRQHLLEVGGNARQMDTIDSALFCLSLDGDAVGYDETKPAELIRHFLAGDGINRWFDKSITLIVGGDGTAAVNFEHSWGDGVAVLRYFNEIYKDSTENPYIHPDSVAEMPNQGDNSVRSIDLTVDGRVQEEIRKASELHNQTVAGLDVDIVRYTGGINKITCKRSRVSPDSVMQLAFQLAYRRAFGEYVGSYESCSTAAFRHGRTETIRPCSMATKAFCEALTTATRSPMLGMLQSCSTIHGQLTKEAAMGQGFDRHLFGLRHMAQLNGIQVPELYEDEAFRRINHTIISTSTLASNSVLAGSFGPVVADGLGIGYSILDEECGAVVTSYSRKRDGRLFVDSLKDAFDQLRDILKKNV